VRALPGIPTIRVFEALACGIPLVCSPWDDAEGLFTPGKDYVVARTGAQMRKHLRALAHDPDAARELAMHGHYTVLSRHTCAHRVDELLRVYADLESGRRGAGRKVRSGGTTPNGNGAGRTARPATRMT
jgi:spore maturation protein CgeB